MFKNLKRGEVGEFSSEENRSCFKEILHGKGIQTKELNVYDNVEGFFLEIIKNENMEHKNKYEQFSKIANVA